MPRRSFRIALAVVAGTFVLGSGVAAYVVKRALSYPEERRAGDGREIAVTIEPGMTFPQIAELLGDKRVIDRPRWFRLYAMHRGVTTQVRSGDYVLRDDMTPEEVLDRLLEGVADVTISVTVPEGLHMLEIRDLLAKAGVIEDPAAFSALARDREFLEEHGIAHDSIEGYLFPETYQFKVPSDPKTVLAAMIRQHRIVWDRIRRENQRAIKRLEAQLGWTDRDILVMASIVEKEAVVDEERSRIAQVFINRLTSPTFNPKRLETDPTIRYGCMVPEQKSAACKKWKSTDRLRRVQLDDRDNPYNTYQHEGLPPGPICNPGAEALEATIRPDRSRFLFFVSRNDGTHVFSRSVAEHERAVDKYQR